MQPLDTEIALKSLEKGISAFRRNDFTRAGIHLSTAARLGDPEAMYLLGLALARLSEMEGEGLSMEVDYWWRCAAEAGHVKAMVNLGLLLSKERNDENGARVLWLSAAKAGLPEAMYNLGVSLNKGHHSDKARWWWEKAAEKGDSSSMEALAEMHRRSGDADGREAWLLRAAENGAVEAMVLVAIMLRSRQQDEEANAYWAKVTQVDRAIPKVLTEAYETRDWEPLGLFVWEWQWTGPRHINGRPPETKTFLK
jgi:TPR repeat protein